MVLRYSGFGGRESYRTEGKHHVLLSAREDFDLMSLPIDGLARETLWVDWMYRESRVSGLSHPQGQVSDTDGAEGGLVLGHVHDHSQNTQRGPRNPKRDLAVDHGNLEGNNLHTQGKVNHGSMPGLKHARGPEAEGLLDVDKFHSEAHLFCHGHVGVDPV